MHGSSRVHEVMSMAGQKRVAFASIVLAALWFLLSLVVDLADVQDPGYPRYGRITWAQIIEQASEHAKNRTRVMEVLRDAPYDLIMPLILMPFLAWVASDARLKLWKRAQTVLALLLFAWPALVGMLTILEAFAALITPYPGMWSEEIEEGWFTTGTTAIPYLAIVLILLARLRARYVPWLRLWPGGRAAT